MLFYWSWLVVWRRAANCYDLSVLRLQLTIDVVLSAPAPATATATGTAAGRLHSVEAVPACRAVDDKAESFAAAVFNQMCILAARLSAAAAAAAAAWRWQRLTCLHTSSSVAAAGSRVVSVVYVVNGCLSSWCDVDADWLSSTCEAILVSSAISCGEYWSCVDGLAGSIRCEEACQYSESHVSLVADEMGTTANDC